MFSIFNIQKKSNNSCKQNEIQNHICNSYNKYVEDGEPSSKSSILNSSCEKKKISFFQTVW